jgi:uncharacterized membrane protein YozB (DUF420 family)
VSQTAVRRSIWVVVPVLVLIVLVFAGIRLATDVPNVLSGRVPDPEAFEHRYARYPWLAYAHILPGVVYLSLAPIQLWRGFRNRHLRWHRRIGRVALIAGLLSGIFAIIFGWFLAWGGSLQASASVVFGAWFLFALTTAYRAIRRRDVRTHRRWMIRAFAVGLAVGTIRIWIGLFQGFAILDFRDAFGVAFWISFLLHAAAAELYLRWRPAASGFAPARA